MNWKLYHLLFTDEWTKLNHKTIQFWYYTHVYTYYFYSLISICIIDFFGVSIKLNNHILQCSNLKCTYKIIPLKIDLLAALRGQEEFWTADCSACLWEGRAEVRKRRDLRKDEALEETLVGAPVQGARRLRRSTKTGSWLMVHPSMVNGTELGAQEWQYVLFLWYGLDPPDLLKHCDGCNAIFSICRALNCKWGRPCHGVSQRAPWQGCGPSWKTLHTYSCTRRPPPLHRLGCEEAKVKSVYVQSQIIKSTARGHGTEGRPTDLWTLAWWEWQCSIHARHEHWLLEIRSGLTYVGAHCPLFPHTDHRLHM